MSTPIRHRKPKGAGFERREEILAASLRLFGERGLYGVSTRQIAQAVGISQPTLYAYFASKDQIAAELAIRAFAELETRLRAANLDLGSPKDVATALRIYVDFGLDNPDAYRIAFMIEAPYGGAAEVKVGAGMAAFGLMRTCMAELHARGLSSTDDPERLAQSVWASLHGLVSLLIARPAFPWVEREALIEGHVRMLAEAATR
jgi:AcrR family transcriptional regulator